MTNSATGNPNDCCDDTNSVSSSVSSSKTPVNNSGIEAKSRTSHDSDYPSDPPPHYLRETSSSENKKSHDSRRIKSISRSSRNVKFLRRKTSFKQKRVSLATHSSTLKDSKFVESGEVHGAGMNCCWYRRCSLHGHCHRKHEDDDSTLRLKQGHSSSSGVSQAFHGSIRDGSAASLDDRYEDIDDLSLFEAAFGESSFPDRAYQENLQIMAKFQGSFGMNGYCLRCHSKFIDFAALSDDRFEEQAKVSLFSSDKQFSREDSPETAAASDEVTESNSLVSPTLDGQQTAGIDTAVEAPETDCVELDFSKPRHVSLWSLIHDNMSANPAAEPESSEKPVGGSHEDDAILPEEVPAASRDLSEDQDVEDRKKMAIKLVREAIEKILLPEVQDTALENEKDNVLQETEVCDSGKGTPLPSDQAKPIRVHESLAEDEPERSKRFLSRKLDKAAAPNHWSNLKKWILLQRFIRELEKVRALDLRSHPIRLSEIEHEEEKVTLRPKTLDGKKSAEEWMLDYALRQAVGQLAPTQKQKVALLVKAFETVAPAQDDSRVPIRTVPRILENEMDTLKVKESVPEPDQIGIEAQAPLPSNEEAKIAAKDDFDLSGSDFAEMKMENGMALASNAETDRSSYIKMWHMIYQHVVPSVAEKVGSGLLDESEAEDSRNPKHEDDSSGKDADSSNQSHFLTKSDIVKLIKETVNEILLAREESFKSQSQTEAISKSGNWSKVKNHVLLRRSIRALEEVQKLRKEPQELSASARHPEPETVKLRSQMMDERKKAEQWMLDYAVRHIVTQLTPARKRRVSMLVEAFEAVVPFPDM